MPTGNRATEIFNTCGCASTPDTLDRRDIAAMAVAAGQNASMKSPNTPQSRP